MERSGEMSDTSVSDWWSSAIIDMEPGKIHLRGQPIESLIESAGFVDMVWLMCLGQPPSAQQRRVLEAAMVASVDHGPQAPSIAAARMAATCGVGINNAMASGVNLLGDVHGGAGQQYLELAYQIRAAYRDGQPLELAVKDQVESYQRMHDRFVPGFGHRFHKPTDPRSEPLLKILESTDDPAIDREFAKITRAVQSHLSQHKPLAINIDGASATLYGALGVPPQLARGLFCLSRSVGILAHAWEQTQQGGRNKGPTPPSYRWTYTG